MISFYDCFMSKVSAQVLMFRSFALFFPLFFFLNFTNIDIMSV